MNSSINHQPIPKSLSERLQEIKGCDLDFISLLQSRDDNGSLRGTCKGQSFHISYVRGEFVLMTMLNHASDPIWGEVFTTLRIACDGFMNADPICQYTTDEGKCLTLEWDIVNPDQTLDDIINNGGVHVKEPVADLVLFGDRKIADYANDETKRQNAEKEAERIKNARIYGIDTGGYKKEDLDKMAEWELFLEYYNVTLVAWRINHDGQRDHSRGGISDAEFAQQQAGLAEMQYGIEYLLYYISKRLDIPVSEPEVDKHVAPDKDIFMRWYRFYDNHFMKQMSDDKWKAFQEARKKHEDISQYLPTGDWHEYAN